MSELAFTSIDSHSIFDGEVNGDAYQNVGWCAWVIDGATALIPGPIELPAFNKAFEEAVLSITGGIDMSVRELLEETIKSLQVRFGNELQNFTREQLPSASIALVKLSRGNALECAVLGDCEVLVKTSSEFRVVQNREVAGFERPVLDQLREFYQSGATVEEALSGIRAQLIKNRELINLDDGYGILNLQLEGLSHAVVEELPADSDTELILLSDGALTSVETYGLYPDRADFYSAICDNGVRAILRDISEKAVENRSMVNYPRFKVMDDATILRLDLTG